MKEVREDCVEEIVESDFFDYLVSIASQSGGFLLSVQPQIPTYFKLISGRRPGPSYDYINDDRAFTDGNVTFVSMKNYYNYPTMNDWVYKYKLSNASYLIIVQRHGDDYQGAWQEEISVTIYGNCPFLSELKTLEEELKIEVD
jgi:hypothetical protein